MQYLLPDLNSIPKVASQFLTDFGHRKIFAFEAVMGTGKTTFILGLLRAMGIEHPEGSPTYSLVNSYESPMYGKVYHFDLYRIEDEEEAYAAPMHLHALRAPAKLRGRRLILGGSSD